MALWIGFYVLNALILVTTAHGWARNRWPERKGTDRFSASVLLGILFDLRDHYVSDVCQSTAGDLFDPQTFCPTKLNRRRAADHEPGTGPRTVVSRSLAEWSWWRWSALVGRRAALAGGGINLLRRAPALPGGGQRAGSTGTFIQDSAFGYILARTGHRMPLAPAPS